MKHGIARSRNVELAYTVEGTGSQTILLLIGLGGRASDWGTTLPRALSERYRVVRVDHRGAGLSPPAPGGYTLRDMARDATAVLDAVGAERAHVVGYSMGGMIAQLMATEHPERVERLVLLSTHFGGRDAVPPTPKALKLFDPKQLLLRAFSAKRMVRFTIDTLFGGGSHTRVAEALEVMLANVQATPTSPVTFKAQMDAIIASDLGHKVSEIKQTTLVIHGTDDPLVPFGNGELLHARLPASRFEILDGVGHMPMLECPEKLSELILGFLATSRPEAEAHVVQSAH